MGCNNKKDEETLSDLWSMVHVPQSRMSVIVFREYVLLMCNYKAVIQWEYRASCITAFSDFKVSVVALTTSVNREADKISIGRYEISTKSLPLPSQPSSNLITLWHKEFTPELLPQCFPKHFGRWLSSCIISDACAVLSEASPSHDPPSRLWAIGYLWAPLLRLYSCHWWERRRESG